VKVDTGLKTRGEEDSEHKQITGKEIHGEADLGRILDGTSIQDVECEGLIPG